MNDDNEQVWLLIIDLSALFWRAWHASAAKPVNEAAAIVLKTVRKFAEHYKHVGIACDAPPYKRKALAQSYKANRPEMDEGARSVLQGLVASLAAEGFPLWAFQGYEADDVIASAVALAGAMTPAPDVMICTMDKDIHQIVGEGVWLASPVNGTTFGAEDVKRKWGVTPGQMGDLLALMGDTSDNVPGVKGVGAKRAAELLVEHGDLAGIKAKAHEIPGAVGKAIGDAMLDGSLDLSRQLVTLETGLPVDIAGAFVARVIQPGTTAPWKEPEPAPVPVATTALAARPEPPEVIGEPVPARPSVALATVDPYSRALDPASAPEAWEMAGHLAEARCFKPTTQAQVFAVVLLARNYGINPVAMLMGCDVIEGKLALTAQMMVGLVLESGKAKYFSLIESTAERATYETHRHGDPRPIQLSYTWEDAQKAQLATKSNWQKMPKTMLRWRASTALARDVYPDVLRGLATKDELREGDIGEDIDPAERAA